MSKNSTQKGTENFILKFSEFLKIVTLLPVILQYAGNFLIAPVTGLFNPQSVSKKIKSGSVCFIHNHQTVFVPAFIQIKSVHRNLGCTMRIKEASPDFISVKNSRL